MILTNKFNIPAVIYEAIEADINDNPYEDLKRSGICFRTTELLGPPLIRTLHKKFKDTKSLIVDASHYLAVQYGKMFHSLCEGVSTPELLYEYKVSRTFDYNGQKITLFGMLDEMEHLDNNVVQVTDNKTCLMSNLGYDKPEYDEQLNVYLHLIRPELSGDYFEFKLQLRYFIKDFTPSKKVNALARAANPYTKAKAEELPNASIYYKSVPVYTEDQIENIILEHIADHIETPERVCTTEERWDTLPKTAVMLTGNKTAKKLCPDKLSAQQYIATQLKPKDQARAYLEDRIPGKHERDKRCQYYCECVSVCPYAKKMGYVI